MIDEANRFVSATRPWELAKTGRADDERLDVLLAVLLNACRVITAELRPFLPLAAERIAAALDELDPRQGRTLFAKVEARV